MANLESPARNLFEIENARNLTREEIAATFVPTRPFWRLLSPKNHVILGARGSGKTAIAKMLSHDHLTRLNDEGARKIVQSKQLIGIYIPTKLEWVGGLRNETRGSVEADKLFQWKLNIASAAAFLVTLRSCLDTYVEDEIKRSILEHKVVAAIAGEWAEGEACPTTIKQARQFLVDIEHKRHQQNVRLRVVGVLKNGENPVGIFFDSDLFSPLRRAITLAARFLDFPETTKWILAIDEAEFLEERHHKILNSHMRADSGELVFKITTMPYHHYTLETLMPTPLDVGHDFEYVYIDQDPISHSGGQEHGIPYFAGELFSKRARASGAKYSGLSLRDFLGPSVLLDSKSSDWSDDTEKLALMEKYASFRTISRAQRLQGRQTDYKDQIVRKLHGALILRDAVENMKGRGELTVYSGATLAVRCGDGNPRRIIRIFNSLLLASRNVRDGGARSRGSIAMIDPVEQTRILTQFSTQVLSRIQAEPRFGPALYKLMTQIGENMSAAFHGEKLTTDQITSVKVEENLGEEIWNLIEAAVGLGLLFPNVNSGNPDQMPFRQGTFHLAYVLAPHFRLLPRRGKARDLRVILNSPQNRSAAVHQLQLF